MGLFNKVTDAISGDDTAETDQTEDTDRETSGAFDIPESAVKDRVNVEKRAGTIHDHYDVTEQQAQSIAQTLKQHMEDTGGYRQHSMISDLEDELDLDYDLLETIVWTERASIETMDRVNTYLDQNEPDTLYELSAPDDDRTHPVTREANQEIEQREGVTMEKLARILIEKAEKYEDEGGTPERMDYWVPHEKFRFSIVLYVNVEF